VKTTPLSRFVLLVAGCLGCQLQAQTNLLLNPGLEAPYTNAVIINVTGLLASNWTASAFQDVKLICAQETADVHGGASCQQVVVTGLNATNVGMFYQPFPYQAGSVYNASVWLRAAASSLVHFELRGSNVVQNSFQAAASHIVTVNTNWQQVVINGGWQNGSNGQFTVNFLTNGTFWIDDAYLAGVTSNYLQAPLLNATSTVPATLFGMHVNEFTAPDNWPPLQQGLMRFWDIGIHWNQVETNTNVFTWTQFDACTNIVWSNNPATKIIYTLGQTPAWAALTTNTPTAKNGPGASSEPSDMNYWSNYVQSVGLRYKGFIQYYEVWNESDSPSYYTGAISNMVTMAQIARNVLTNLDPTIKILGPNITLGGLGWLEQFIQAGGPPPDIVTFHDYVASRPESSLGEVAGLRDMLSYYPQWSAQPIWCTEGAAFTNANPQFNAGTVSRAYLFWWTQNVQNWNWYTWDKGASVGYVPLSINPPSELPAAGGVAYSNTVNWLVGAQMTDLVIDSNGTWAATLQRLGFTNAYVLWNPDLTTNYVFPSNWNVYQMRDLSNNVTSLIGVSNVVVDGAPFILDQVPSLAVGNLSNTQITLLWPGPATGLQLYGATNLAPANWFPVTNAVVNSNGIMQVTLPATNMSHFYRLGPS
jgi:hypothetical protein